MCVCVCFFPALDSVSEFYRLDAKNYLLERLRKTGILYTLSYHIMMSDISILMHNSNNIEIEKIYIQENKEIRDEMFDVAWTQQTQSK